MMDYAIVADGGGDRKQKGFKFGNLFKKNSLASPLPIISTTPQFSTCIGLPTCAIPSTSFSDDALADVSHRRAISDLVIVTPPTANSPPISPFMQQQPSQQTSFIGLKPPQTPDSGINQPSASSYLYSSNSSSSSNTFASSKMYSGSVDSSSAAANASFSSNRFSWPKSSCSSSSTSSCTSEMSSLSTALSNNLRLTGDVSTAASGNSLFTSPPKNNGSVSSPASGTPQRLPRFVAGTTIAEEDEEAEEGNSNSNAPISSTVLTQPHPDSTTNPVGSSSATDSMETGFAATVAQVSRRTGTSAQELYARMKEVRRRPEDVRNRLRGQVNGVVSSSSNGNDSIGTGTSKRLSLPASLHLPPHLRQKAIQLLEEPMTRRERRMSLASFPVVIVFSESAFFIPFRCGTFSLINIPGICLRKLYSYEICHFKATLASY
ncbi:unnamed protein product [Rodentolepis nana]|uniref:Uncharacterized protein n=1 Tax=Rodentolepis nana TaxID=102285 RepID=A0A0R3T4C6_RODNA|nr:unnamed protein product [Rodentolepis nana]